MWNDCEEDLLYGTLNSDLALGSDVICDIRWHPSINLHDLQKAGHYSNIDKGLHHLADEPSQMVESLKLQATQIMPLSLVSSISWETGRTLK